MQSAKVDRGARASAPKVRAVTRSNIRYGVHFISNAILFCFLIVMVCGRIACCVVDPSQKCCSLHCREMVAAEAYPSDKLIPVGVTLPVYAGYNVLDGNSYAAYGQHGERVINSK